MHQSLQNLASILILLAVIAFVVRRLPRIDVNHSAAYLTRRRMNWLPLGLTYAFLYMGRYNLTVSKNAFADLKDVATGVNLMSNSDFGVIFGLGTLTYGFAFLLNGPLTDRYGGKKAILLGAGGSALVNLLMGLVTIEVTSSQGTGVLTDLLGNVAKPLFLLLNSFASLFGMGSPTDKMSVLLPVFGVLYSANMYFQSFGAVAIVKSNTPWFHVRERGVFGSIFGILISLGVYFAYDWNGLIVKFWSTEWVFLTPTILLIVSWVFTFRMVKDTPGEAGFEDFDTGDVSSGDTGPRKGALEVFGMMVRNPVIMTIAVIEFCSGFLRQAIMQWYLIFAKQVGIMSDFVPSNWGLLLCCAGIMGGMFAGFISDHVFGSRRGPVAAVLYATMLVGAILMIFALESSMLGWLVVAMSLCIIGVHGMLSGTASMDFGGKRNVGIAVGIIDGFVYLGSGTMSLLYGWRLPNGEAAKVPSNWSEWPLWMIPLAVLGLLLAARLWNARPRPGGSAH